MIRAVVATSAIAIAFAAACTVTLDAGSNPSRDGGCDDGASCEADDADHDGANGDAAACEGGLTTCVDQCVDLQVDESNCGSCGDACGGDELCVAGECRHTQTPSGCSTCPCAACSAGTMCCDTVGASGAPLCVEGDRCP
jgi:hypothetical protein